MITALHLEYASSLLLAFMAAFAASQVQLTLKSLRTLEAKNDIVCSAEAPAASKKAAQKLANFRVSS